MKPKTIMIAMLLLIIYDIRGQSSTVNTFLGYLAGNNNTGTYNTFIGGSAGVANTTGTNNSVLGSQAFLANTTGISNCAVGAYSLNRNTTGGGNTAVGEHALWANTTGSYNNAFGLWALINNSTGSNNNAVGNEAMEFNTASDNNAFGYKTLYSNSSGTPNNAFGNLALFHNTSGSNNNAFGYQTLYTNSIGNFNAAFGDQALYYNTANSNSAHGYQALYNNSTGTNNNALGYMAGTTNTTGSNNTLVGYSADVSSSGLSNATAIGANAKVYSSNTIQLGDNSTAISIGYSGSALTSQTKFDVLYSTGSAFTSGPVYGGHFINSNTISGATTPYVYGAYTSANGTESNGSVYHYGLAATASGATNNVAVSAVSTGNGGNTYGGYFNASSSGSGSTYGIYATAPSSVNNTKSNWAGFFNNDVYINGNGWINAAWTVSDKQFKTNINNILNPTEILKKLKPQSFYYDTANTVGMSFSNKKQYGFIAQDVQKVLPELVAIVTRPEVVDVDGKVKYTAVTHLGVNYTAFIALLTSALQAQQVKIDAQDSINKAMQKQINQLLANNGFNNASNATTAINTQGASLSNSDIIVLNQNQPNPFAEQTTITYVIPQSAGTAQIMFYDMSGKQVKSVNITTKGKGSLVVYANDLTNGTYSYTLIVDSKIIDTKQMIKQQ